MIAALGGLLPLVPWIVSRRDSYIYHYLPAYGFGVALVAGKIARALTDRKRLGLVGVGAITLCSWWVSPVNAEIPVSRTGYELRLWLPAWRMAPLKAVTPSASPGLTNSPR
jgi:dolichyl-phosphate-mannose--protein O-mannosyl transferase